MTASEAVAQASMVANSTGFDVWIVVANGTLKITQDVDVVLKTQVIETIHPTGQNSEIL